MGKYKLAPSVVQFKGSLQGSTFQKCGQVFSIRKHNTPVQKRSVKQSASKNRFEHVQTSFRTLDSSEKQTFTDQRGNFPRFDSLGNEYTLQTAQLFSSTNNALTASNQPVLRTMSDPVVYPVITPNLVALRNSILAMDIITLPDQVPLGFTLRIEASRPLSNGTLAVENDFKLLGFIVNGLFQSSVNWFSAYTNQFGNTNSLVGLSIAARSTLLSNDNGQAGTPLTQYGIIED